MSSRTRVGIDVDGVIRNFTGKILDKLEENGVQAEYPKTWDELTAHKVNGNTVGELLWKHKTWAEDVFVNAELMRGAKKAYEMFIDDPRLDVYVVTSQSKDTKQYTEQWLKDHHFDKHIKTYYLYDKTKAPCQVLIDDKPSNVESYNRIGRAGIMINRLYNLNIKTKYRATNLEEAYKILTTEIL